MAVLPLKVSSTFSNKLPFSSAAATRSLSWSCLFTCASLACEPLETFTCFYARRAGARERDREKGRARMHARQPFDDVGTREKNETRERARDREKEEDIRNQIKTRRTSTLNLLGSTLNSCTRMLNPIKVAIEQCSTVGVKYTVARDFSSSTTIFSGDTTANCSSEYGCSGSLMSLMCAKISRASIGSLFEEEEEEPPAATAALRSRSARFRREMEDEALFFVVDLTRGLALSNEDIIISCI